MRRFVKHTHVESPVLSRAFKTSSGRFSFEKIVSHLPRVSSLQTGELLGDFVKREVASAKDEDERIRQKKTK